MSVNYQHEIKNQSSLYDKSKSQNNERIHITDSSLAPEKQFEPWTLSDSNHEMVNRPSIIEPSKTSYFTRNYGWNEIEENEDETKRLRQLLSIWDAERIAILKLQHDLDRNIFQRTCDYIKRIGQSIGLALWLWVHRPANCSHISNLYQQQSSFSLIDNDKSQDFIVTSCSDTQNDHLLKKDSNQKKQEYSIPPSIDTLPDSLWLKHFVLDESEESLPPIARAMKNMLDHDVLIWNSENEKENIWPHFVNENRMTQNKTSLRNIHRNNKHQPSSSLKSSSSKYTTDKKKSNIKFTNINPKTKNKIDQYSTTKANFLIQEKPNNTRKKKNRSKSKTRKSSQHSKSKKNK